MSHRFSLTFEAVPPEPLFDMFMETYRAKGFHIEEADRVEMTIYLAHDSALGFLFGLGRKRIFADFNHGETGAFVELRITGKKEFADEVVDSLAQNVSVLSARRRAQQRLEPTPPAPQVVIMKETVQREIVKRPCAYCGELVENTVPKCPYCGAGLS